MKQFAERMRRGRSRPPPEELSARESSLSKDVDDGASYHEGAGAVDVADPAAAVRLESENAELRDEISLLHDDLRAQKQVRDDIAREIQKKASDDRKKARRDEVKRQKRHKKYATRLSEALGLLEQKLGEEEQEARLVRADLDEAPPPVVGGKKQSKKDDDAELLPDERRLERLRDKVAEMPDVAAQLLFRENSKIVVPEVDLHQDQQVAPVQRDREVLVRTQTALSFATAGGAGARADAAETTETRTTEEANPDQADAVHDEVAAERQHLAQEKAFAAELLAAARNELAEVQEKVAAEQKKLQQLHHDIAVAERNKERVVNMLEIDVATTGDIKEDAAAPAALTRAASRELEIATTSTIDIFPKTEVPSISTGAAAAISPNMMQQGMKVPTPSSASNNFVATTPTNFNKTATRPSPVQTRFMAELLKRSGSSRSRERSESASRFRVLLEGHQAQRQVLREGMSEMKRVVDMMEARSRSVSVTPSVRGVHAKKQLYRPPESGAALAQRAKEQEQYQQKHHVEDAYPPNQRQQQDRPEEVELQPQKSPLAYGYDSSVKAENSQPPPAEVPYAYGENRRAPTSPSQQEQQAPHATPHDQERGAEGESSEEQKLVVEVLGSDGGTEDSAPRQMEPLVEVTDEGEEEEDIELVQLEPAPKQNAAANELQKTDIHTHDQTSGSSISATEALTRGGPQVFDISSPEKQPARKVVPEDGPSAGQHDAVSLSHQATVTAAVEVPRSPTSKEDDNSYEAAFNFQPEQQEVLVENQGPHVDVTLTPDLAEGEIIHARTHGDTIEAQATPKAAEVAVGVEKQLPLPTQSRDEEVMIAGDIEGAEKMVTDEVSAVAAVVDDPLVDEDETAGAEDVTATQEEAAKTEGAGSVSKNNLLKTKMAAGFKNLKQKFSAKTAGREQNQDGANPTDATPAAAAAPPTSAAAPPLTKTTRGASPSEADSRVGGTSKSKALFAKMGKLMRGGKGKNKEQSIDEQDATPVSESRSWLQRSGGARAGSSKESNASSLRNSPALADVALVEEKANEPTHEHQPFTSSVLVEDDEFQEPVAPPNINLSLPPAPASKTSAGSSAANTSKKMKATANKLFDQMKTSTSTFASNLGKKMTSKDRAESVASTSSVKNSPGLNVLELEGEGDEKNTKTSSVLAADAEREPDKPDSAFDEIDLKTSSKGYADTPGGASNATTTLPNLMQTQQSEKSSQHAEDATPTVVERNDREQESTSKSPSKKKLKFFDQMFKKGSRSGSSAAKEKDKVVDAVQSTNAEEPERNQEHGAPSGEGVPPDPPVGLGTQALQEHPPGASLQVASASLQVDPIPVDLDTSGHAPSALVPDADSEASPSISVGLVTQEERASSSSPDPEAKKKKGFTKSAVGFLKKTVGGGKSSTTSGGAGERTSAGPSSSSKMSKKSKKKNKFDKAAEDSSCSPTSTALREGNHTNVAPASPIEEMFFQSLLTSQHSGEKAHYHVEPRPSVCSPEQGAMGASSTSSCSSASVSSSSPAATESSPPPEDCAAVRANRSASSGACGSRGVARGGIGVMFGSLEPVVPQTLNKAGFASGGAADEGTSTRDSTTLVAATTGSFGSFAGRSSVGGSSSSSSMSMNSFKSSTALQPGGSKNPFDNWQTFEQTTSTSDRAGGGSSYQQASNYITRNQNIGISDAATFAPETSFKPHGSSGVKFPHGATAVAGACPPPPGSLSGGINIAPSPGALSAAGASSPYAGAPPPLGGGATPTPPSPGTTFLAHSEITAELLAPRGPRPMHHVLEMNKYRAIAAGGRTSTNALSSANSPGGAPGSNSFLGRPLAGGVGGGASPLTPSAEQMAGPLLSASSSGGSLLQPSLSQTSLGAALQPSNSQSQLLALGASDRQLRVSTSSSLLGPGGGAAGEYSGGLNTSRDQTQLLTPSSLFNITPGVTPRCHSSLVTPRYVTPRYRPGLASKTKRSQFLSYASHSLDLSPEREGEDAEASHGHLSPIDDRD
eukprot:CAMPEP_0179007412 /NCGR_PEP_ID=MMETSP0795-20121207/15147_1 /TAXON_ID=88552 /ORGANISM="Amoebophrya sp., Strain Ameob2" /LENGTH=1981 /DNA_ID=CAMNT_0020702385 /DNA_START=43 /DNA_END=5990 /DNA_ORIENTATION=+